MDNQKRVILIVILLVVFTVSMALVNHLRNTETIDYRNQASTAQVIRVCNSGCDTNDINQAINQLQNDGTIFIDEAEYSGPGIVSREANWDMKLPEGVKSFNIKGRGNDGQTKWLSNADAPNGHILQFKGLNDVKVNIKHIWFRTSNTNNSTIHIYDSNTNLELNLDEVMISDSEAAGIYYDGNSKGKITNSSFSNNFYPGVSLHGNSNVIIEKSTFLNHTNPAIDAKDNSTLKVTNSNISNSQKSGIYIGTNAKAEIYQNTFSLNKPYSIEAENIATTNIRTAQNTFGTADAKSNFTYVEATITQAPGSSNRDCIYPPNHSADFTDDQKVDIEDFLCFKDEYMKAR